MYNINHNQDIDFNKNLLKDFKVNNLKYNLEVQNKNIDEFIRLLDEYKNYINQKLLFDYDEIEYSINNNNDFDNDRIIEKENNKITFEVMVKIIKLYNNSKIDFKEYCYDNKNYLNNVFFKIKGKPIFYYLIPKNYDYKLFKYICKGEYSDDIKYKLNSLYYDILIFIDNIDLIMLDEDFLFSFIGHYSEYKIKKLVIKLINNNNLQNLIDKKFYDIMKFLINNKYNTILNLILGYLPESYVKDKIINRPSEDEPNIFEIVCLNLLTNFNDFYVSIIKKFNTTNLLTEFIKYIVEINNTYYALGVLNDILDKDDKYNFTNIILSKFHELDNEFLGRIIMNNINDDLNIYTYLSEKNPKLNMLMYLITNNDKKNIESLIINDIITEKEYFSITKDNYNIFEVSSIVNPEILTLLTLSKYFKKEYLLNSNINLIKNNILEYINNENEKYQKLKHTFSICFNDPEIIEDEEDENICNICWSCECNVKLSCNHKLCSNCLPILENLNCPFCLKKIEHIM